MLILKRSFHSSIRLLSRSKLQHHIPNSSNLSFEQEYSIRSSLERLITEYSKRKIPQISLDSLIELSKQDPKNNAIATINYLTIFNAKRLAAFRSLPYLVVLNPHISETYNLYLKLLQLLLGLPRKIDKFIPGTEKEVHQALLEFSDIHRDAIPSLSIGFQEVSDFFPKESIVMFLNAHFSDKINMETMTNNFIQTIDSQGDNVGIVTKSLNVAELIHIYAGFVNDMAFIKYYKQVPVQIDFGLDIRFPYIGNHLEYIFTEILKNSIRAHIESNKAEKPIIVTIVQNSTVGSQRSLSIRFRDEGGGIPPEIEANIFDYSFTSVGKEAKDGGMSDNMIPGEDISTIAGMGYGLPLTKAYVEQFGGTLELQSCYGLGTDVYIELIEPDNLLL